MTDFLAPESLTESTRIGGKGAGLWMLHRLGAPVPPWRVLPADVPGNIGDPSDFQKTLMSHYPELDGGAGLAVRSSGLLEDQRGASCAGAFETRFCNRASELPAALEAVLDSASTMGGADSNKGAMAVILQRRIQPILSGVLFSAHPSHAHPAQAYVEYVTGSPEGLVDGTRKPESALLDPWIGAVLQGTEEKTSLPADVAVALCHWLRQVEKSLGWAADMEWAVDECGLWLLQARPVTRLYLDPTLLPPEAATSWFFDQRFSEPLTPITKTALLPLILRAGIEEPLALRGTRPPENVCYAYAGLPYVPLSIYGAILSGLPSRWLTTDIRQIFPGEIKGPKYLPSLRALASIAVLSWRERRRFVGNLAAWEHFRDNLEGALEAIPDANGEDGVAWRDGWQRLDALTLDFLRIHRWSLMLADGLYGLHRRLPERVSRLLLGPLHDRPTLITHQANRARTSLTRDATADDDFIRRFGHRSPSLDYGTPTWSESFGGLPLPAIPTLAALEEQEAVGGILARLLALREEQRFVWETILARQRRLLLQAGDVLTKGGLLTENSQVMWMTADELTTALQGGTPPDRAVLWERERTCHIYRAAARPTHLGPQEVVPQVPSTLDSDVQHVYRGLGASAGIARGHAAVYTRAHSLPEVLYPDTILVLPSLDPGATVVMETVAGLVVERGGLLSHAAIVAREYGIPLVVNIPGVTESIRPGAFLELDGEKGTVRVL